MKYLRFLISGMLSLASINAFSEVMHFDQKVFDELRQQGKPVIVHTHATWCPICKKQQELLSSIEEEPKFKPLTVLVVDIDADKDIMQSLNLSKRSAFVAYKGNAEIGRSIADTNKDSIEALFSKVL
jgi:thiol-disulfide isomerase/thioredoxin